MYIPETLGDIELIVQQKAEESTQLEFKRQLPEAGKNDDIAKDVSAFANSDGGVLVYGIGEDGQGRADSLNSIHLTGAAERVALVARQSLDGPVPIESTSIPSASEPGHGFLVISVPRSGRAPHFFKGAAWGRLSRVIAPLTRRQIGELLAHQLGFAEEFNLVSPRPGRVRVEKTTEPAQGRVGYSHYLIFLNDGNSDVFDVRAEYGEAEGVHVVDQDIFPVEVMHPDSQFRIHLVVTLPHKGSVQVRTRWHDVGGQQQEAKWTLVV